MTVAVITGSTKGIGRGLAEAFAIRGLDVVVTGRSGEQAAEVAAGLPGTGSGLGLALDVTDPSSVQGVWDAAAERFGRVDLWINNAGVAHTTQNIVDIPSDDVAAMVTTNMLGTIYGSQVAARGMSAQGGGKLFNVLGGGSDGKIREYMGVYGATKRGLKMFTDALVKETAGGPVLVGEIRPGILITDGWLREAHAAQAGYVESNRKALNVLADHVDDVAPWIADQVLACSKHGAAIAWLTPAKIAGRFSTAGFKKRDVLGSYQV
jgi:NAD(P)-dependent dehydrogenase (short-subunit alcohol dehydrogenase family)